MDAVKTTLRQEAQRGAAAGAVYAALTLIESTGDRDLQLTLMRVHLELKRRERGASAAVVPVNIPIGIGA